MSDWSKDAPTTPGFYWCHQYGRTRMVSVWKYPSANDNRLFTNEDGAPLDDMEMYEGGDVERSDTTPGICMKEDK